MTTLVCAGVISHKQAPTSSSKSSSSLLSSWLESYSDLNNLVEDASNLCDVSSVWDVSNGTLGYVSEPIFDALFNDVDMAEADPEPRR